MQKIENPIELEKLANDLKNWSEIDKKASIEYHMSNPYPDESILDGLLGRKKLQIEQWGDAQVKHRMAARFSAFPNVVEVSPAVARFLYTVNNEHEGKIRELQDTDKSENAASQIMFKTPLAVALTLLFPNPFSAAELAIEGGKSVKAFLNMSDYNKKLKIIMDERNEIVAGILGNYRLVEEKPGEYLLRLQEFEDHARNVSTGRTFETMVWQTVPNAGIDPNLNHFNLPPLPSAPPHRRIT